jgi:CRP-like cAMP-binding protein
VTQESTALIVGISILWISTLSFTVLYVRRLRAVTREYSESRLIIESVVATSKHRCDQLSREIKNLEVQISQTQGLTTQMIGATSELSERVEGTLKALQKSNAPEQGILDSMFELQRELGRLKDAQVSLETKLSAATPSTVRTADALIRTPRDESPEARGSTLTETENVVVQFILTEGPKTAKDVEQKIGRTREHTARLMKKLWQEGYVERETHRIPFTYRAAEPLKSLEKQSTENNSSV